MSAHDLVIANQGMSSARTDINNALQALGSTSIGSSEPTTKYTGQLWIDNGDTPWLLKVYDGSGWITISSINATTDKAWPVLASVGEDILFDADDTYDIGDATNKLQNLYLSGTGNANTFYQEGTFTPSLSGLTDTPSTQIGLYRRIGSLVFISGRLILSGKTGVSGNVTLTGLPFTAAATGLASLAFSQVENLTFASGDLALTGNINVSAKTATLTFTKSGDSSDAVTDGDIASNFGMIFSGAYIMA